MRSNVVQYLGLVAVGLSIISTVDRGASAQETVPLIAAADAAAGWTFDNGREFPGAVGSLTIDTTGHAGHAALKLVGDFSKGGQYVQAGRKIDKVDIRELSMWVRNPDGDKFTLRLNDAGGQTHQIALHVEASPDWQRVVLPLERFFARRGEADAVPHIAKYESWGGAKDGRWHGPAAAIYILIGKPADNGRRTLELSEITILPRPTEVPGAEAPVVLELDEILEGEHDWRFTRGEEFKGAKGSLTVAKDEPAAGQSCLKLSGDFTGGGAYVAALKDLTSLGVKDVTAVRLRVKTQNAASITVQLVDATGQTHQRARTAVIADGNWHELVLKPSKVAGGEHWGGANDGKWHGPPTRLGISVTNASDEKARQPTIYLAEIRADALLPVFAQPAAFKADFEGGDHLATTWVASDGVAVDAKAAFKGARSLLLARTLEQAERPCSVVGPTFPVSPGQWQIDLACKTDLHSPDNSYSGVARLECLDAGGKVVDRVVLADVFGSHDWQAIGKRVDIPKGVVGARFQAQLNKTYGSFWIDELSAAFLAPSPRKDDRIARVLFSTARLGNLLFPEDPRQVGLAVEVRKPLRDEQRTVSYAVRDYWGAEQMMPATVALQTAQKMGDRWVYEASIDLAKVPLEVGRYYELHASIPQEGGEPFTNYTSFAILPEAATKRYKPEEVPFTSRNWDNRITEYIKLSDRLGVRVCGVWGGWSGKAPYKAEAPQLDLVKQLGMGWLTTTPIAKIERGDKGYDEEALRKGVRNLIEQYGNVRPMIINLGNEPHGKGERVLANVAAYKAVYEEVKKVDPGIPVVATSVEPNEEYFKAGYGQWCDAYDFHIYETSDDVRRTLGDYKALAEKYHQVKPIWSTELGLNSQGMTRHVVAVELIKKFTTFFAAGGQSVSWFGLLYPDPEGKDHGSSGNSHNVFDCRYNRYCPRLDAIAYYNAVNAISIKKFVAERQYAQDITAILFRDRDGHALQVLWKKHGRRDVAIPLAGVKGVQVIRIDGSRRSLDAAGESVTLSISEDPLLLLYDGGPQALPEALGDPRVAFQFLPADLSKRAGRATVGIVGSDDEVELVPPAMWSGGGVRTNSHSTNWSIAIPPASKVREADFTVRITVGGARRGELYCRIPVGE